MPDIGNAMSAAEAYTQATRFAPRLFHGLSMPENFAVANQNLIEAQRRASQQVVNDALTGQQGRNNRSAGSGHAQ